MMHTYGYGNWERIRVEIRNAWQFNFDWFFKSRNASELGRRADLLIKLVEKENSDLEGMVRRRPDFHGYTFATAMQRQRTSVCLALADYAWYVFFRNGHRACQ